MCVRARVCVCVCVTHQIAKSSIHTCIHTNMHACIHVPPSVDVMKYCVLYTHAYIHTHIHTYIQAPPSVDMMTCCVQLYALDGINLGKVRISICMYVCRMCGDAYHTHMYYIVYLHTNVCNKPWKGVYINRMGGIAYHTHMQHISAHTI